MSLPFVWITLSFICGIILSKYLHPTFLLIYSSAFICGFFLIVCKRRKPLFFLLIALAGALAYRNSLSCSSQNIAYLSPASEVYITATVAKPPIEKTISSGKKAILILQAEEAENGGKKQKVDGLLKATIYKPLQTYYYGDRLFLKGKLYHPYNFGGFDYKRYLATRRIYCLFSGKGKDVQLLSKNRNLLLSPLFRFKEILENIIDKNLASEQQISLLKAILIGERFDISKQLKKIFINSGTVHILSISGLHVGIVVTIFLLFFRIIHLPYKVYYPLTIIFIILYAILSGARVPVIRATILTIVILGGRLLNRPSSVYNSLCFAAFLILAIQPLYLFDYGFQFSFFCVFFIIYLSPKIKEIFCKDGEIKHNDLKNKRICHKKFPSFLINSFSVSLSAWLGIAPLASYYFKSFVPITILANLVIVPLLFVIVANGFLLILSAPIPVLLSFFSAIESFSLILLIKIASFFSHLPFARFHFSLTFLGMISCYFFLFLFSGGIIKTVFNQRSVAIN